jgi:sugar lactone lactonase YvrE
MPSTPHPQPAPGSRARRWIAPLLALALVAALVVLVAPPLTGGPAGAQGHVLEGQVRAAGSPAAGAAVVLVRAARAEGLDPTILGEALAGPDGSFTLSHEPVADDDVTYVVADLLDGEELRPAVLATVLPTGPPPAQVVVNELTTVAAAYATAQFSELARIAGPHPGLPNAAGMAQNIADATTGEVAEVLATAPNGSETSTLATVGSLANAVAACAADDLACDALLAAATAPGRPAPGNTFEALAEIARHPGTAPADVFAVTELGPTPYAPARDLPPAAWTVALRFDGDGESLDGPGNFAVDHEGNLWVANNYQYGADRTVPVCGSDEVFKFSPTGQFVPGSPFAGGGLSGVGFGVEIDRYGDVWLANYGFTTPGCPPEDEPPHNSLSKFTPDGVALSPEATPASGGGFTGGGLDWPQGLLIADDGDIWVANCASSSVTRVPDGDPTRMGAVTDLGLDQAFDIAESTNGNLFVTGTASDNVAVLDTDGNPLPHSPVSGGGLHRPMGVVADSTGHVWVANSGVITLPCPERPTGGPTPGSLTLLDPEGRPVADTAFSGGGATVPWGLTVDGDDNVWVADFFGERLVQFCGTDPSTCPPGTTTGDPISPDVTGYAFDGLVRNTGVVVDPSGNVWVTNNWEIVPVPSNPGGHQIVAFVGMAAPVQPPAPLPKPEPPVTSSTTTAVVPPGKPVTPRYTG